MSRSKAAQLAAYQRRYRELAGQLAQVGYISAGTVLQRRTRCGTPGCRCQADPPRLHGPYWQWSATIEGKTVTRRLSESEARLYAEWIGNERQLQKLITQMRQIATQATELILQDAKHDSAEV